VKEFILTTRKINNYVIFFENFSKLIIGSLEFIIMQLIGNYIIQNVVCQIIYKGGSVNTSQMEVKQLGIIR
jgi:hypothetical protein